MICKQAYKDTLDFFNADTIEKQAEVGRRIIPDYWKTNFQDRIDEGLTTQYEAERQFVIAHCQPMAVETVFRMLEINSK